MLIYKIFRPDEWAALQANGETAGAPVDLADGFVHFSTAMQLAETAAKHFAGADGLMLLAVDAAGLGAALRWEVSRGGALFPHLYRPLRIGDVVWARPMPLTQAGHLVPDAAERHVDPTRRQFDTFKALPRDTPIEMLNLVRLNARADYPQGHALAEKRLSGADAYANYGQHSGPVLAKVGGRILWRGTFETVLIGPPGSHWDHVFIAQYPNAGAFLAMVTDPVYQKAVVHRQAAVETSRLIRCAAGDQGAVFG